MLVAVFFTTAASASAAYAPVDRRGPPLSVPATELERSLTCSGDLASGRLDPVLLVPGTGFTPDQYDWNYARAFDMQGRAHCGVTLLGNGLGGDLQLSAERLVSAIRTMHRRAGRPIDIIGHSQGGMLPRWALRFWPDVRPMVDDLVGLSPSNHGADEGNGACAVAPCPAGLRQQLGHSSFIRALNSDRGTFDDVDYTVVYSHTEELTLIPQSGLLRGGGPNVSGFAIQDLCPGHVVEHGGMGTYDGPAYAVATDALDHEGPARLQRIDTRVCRTPLMPGVNPATFATDFATYAAGIAPNLAKATPLSAEPPLRCYVTAACPPAIPQVRLERRCIKGRMVARVTGEENLVRAVSFKLGRRAVLRSGAAPFHGTIPRRALRHVHTTRLRAVVELIGSGEPTRLTLARALPRCAR